MEAIKVCKSCLMLALVLESHLIIQGVCNACNYLKKKKINWKDREKNF